MHNCEIETTIFIRSVAKVFMKGKHLLFEYFLSSSFNIHTYRLQSTQFIGR